VFHWVDGGARVAGTLQIGRPAWLAERTGLPVVSDLRSADVAAGGQGAPLVSLFDVLLLGGSDVPRAAMNLGGIANLTVVPALLPGAENPHRVWDRRSGSPSAAPLAYDAGPANALIDAAVVAATDGAETFDHGGSRAARGKVDEALLALLLDDFFLAQPPPKTTGKERYHHGFTEAAVDELGHDPAVDDLVATLTAHAAEVAAAECRRHGVAEVVASGGGTDNPVLMRHLAERLAPARLRTIDEYGIPSAAKEAYAFAVLGFLTWHGLPGTVPSCTGARHAAVLGSITPGSAPLALSPTPAAGPTRLEIVRA
jgi:anhydro-N-acetylmuramic acid kinase